MIDLRFAGLDLRDGGLFFTPRDLVGVDRLRQCLPGSGSMDKRSPLLNGPDFFSIQVFAVGTE